MREELARTRAVAEKLDAMCQLAGAEAARLRVQFGAQEDDRQHLIRRVMLAKREAYRARKELASLQSEMDGILMGGGGSGGGDGGVDGGGGGGDTVAAAADTDRAQLRSRGPARPASACAGGRLSGGAGDCRPATAAAAGGSGGGGWRSADRRTDGHGAAAGAQQHADAGCCQGGQPSAARLQRLLDSSQRQLRALRGAHVAECARRARMQALLVDTLEQLRRQRATAVRRHACGERAALAEQQGPGCTASFAARPASARRTMDRSGCSAGPWGQRPATAAAAAGRHKAGDAAGLPEGAAAEGADAEAPLEAQEQLLCSLLQQCLADAEDEGTEGREGPCGEGGAPWEAVEDADRQQQGQRRGDRHDSSGAASSAGSGAGDGYAESGGCSGGERAAQISGASAAAAAARAGAAPRASTTPCASPSARVPPPSSMPDAAAAFTSPAFSCRWPLAAPGASHHLGAISYGASLGGARPATAHAARRPQTAAAGAARPGTAAAGGQRHSGGPGPELPAHALGRRLGSQQRRPATAAARAGRCTAAGNGGGSGGGGGPQTTCGRASVVDVNAWMADCLPAGRR